MYALNVAESSVMKAIYSQNVKEAKSSHTIAFHLLQAVIKDEVDTTLHILVTTLISVLTFGRWIGSSQNDVSLLAYHVLSLELVYQTID